MSSTSSSRSSSPEPRGYTLEQEKFDLMVEALKQAKVSEIIIKQLKEESLDIEGIIKVFEEAIANMDEGIEFVKKMIELARIAREFQCGGEKDNAGAGPSSGSSKP